MKVVAENLNVAFVHAASGSTPWVVDFALVLPPWLVGAVQHQLDE